MKGIRRVALDGDEMIEIEKRDKEVFTIETYEVIIQ